MKCWVKLGYLTAFCLIGIGLTVDSSILIGMGAIITPFLGILLD